MKKSLLIGLMLAGLLFISGNITHAAETLTFVNHWTTTFDVLDYDARISSRAATNIIAHRDGPDGIYGTDDDDPFDTIEELDAVPYVGPATLEDLANYAYNWYPPSEPPYAYLLDFVNHETTTFEILDIDVGLDRRAAKNIIAHRDGPDGIYGTEDDDPFDTRYELDKVSYVGPSALAKLEAYAAIWILSPLDYKEDALELLEGLDALIEHKAIKNQLKKAEDNLSSSLKWFIDDWHIVRHSVFDRERIVTQEVRGIAKIAREEEIPQYEQIIAECKDISQKLARADELIARKALEQIKEMEGVGQGKISQGYEALDKGLQRLEERDAAMADLGIDWPRYDEAINCFKHAWQHAQQAIPRIIIPPGLPPKIDSDNDGLPDRDEDTNRNGVYEPWLGESNPYDADSDGDGLDDREEIEVYNTDPNNPDSDSDGLNDYEEINTYHTDPNNPDSDGDGMRDGFEVKYGFKPLNSDENDDGVIDGNEDPDEDGLPNSDEDKYNTDPFDPDTDDDGIPDGEDPDPTSSDSDSDGLNDYEEINTYYTDPKNSDTDGDGMRDGFEVKYGFDPLNSDENDDGVIDGNEDPDEDGLPNSDEDKYKTVPFNPDTDDDGIPDGEDPDPTHPAPYFRYEAKYDRESYVLYDGREIEPTDLSLGKGGKVTYTFYDINKRVSAIFIVTDIGPHAESFKVTGTEFNLTPLAERKRTCAPGSTGKDCGENEISYIYFIPEVNEEVEIIVTDAKEDHLKKYPHKRFKEKIGGGEDYIIYRCRRCGITWRDPPGTTGNNTCPYGIGAPRDLGADISFKAGPAGMTAFRPQTPHLRECQVPEDKEENPGAGIRYNGDDDNGNHIADRNDTSVSNENDLIKLVLEIGPSNIVDALEYVEFVLKRDNNNIRVWKKKDKEGKILFGNNEKVITFSSNKKTVWVENVNQGEALLELYARKKSSGQETSLDKVKFFSFNSVVIALGGESQSPSLPRKSGHGVFIMGDTLYAQGYDVHIYDEDRTASAEAEIRSAIKERGITEVAIFGYSHGGGSTYDISDHLNATPPQGTFTIPYTAYIDAVRQPGPFAEARRPPSAGYLINYYQRRLTPFRGGPVDDLAGGDNEYNLTDGSITHKNIDDQNNVQSSVMNQLIDHVKPW